MAEEFSALGRSHFNALSAAISDQLEASRAAMVEDGLTGGESLSVLLSALATCAGAVLIACAQPFARHKLVQDISNQLHLTLMRSAGRRAGKRSVH